MDDSLKKENGELQDGSNTTSVFVPVNFENDPAFQKRMRIIGYPTQQDLEPLLDPQAPKMEDTVEPEFFESLDNLQNNQSSDSVQQNADTSSHWQNWVEGYVKILSIRIYYYRMAYESFFEKKESILNGTSHALGYLEYSEKFVLKADIIKKSPATPKWLKRIHLHIAAFQENELNFIRFIQFEEPVSKLSQEQPKRGEISKRISGILDKRNNPQNNRDHSIKDKIIPYLFFATKPNEYSKKLDRLFSRMAAEFDILKKEIAAIGREIEKCSEMVSENTEVKNADLLNHGKKIILHVMRDGTYLSNRDIKTEIKKLSSKASSMDLESSTISSYIRDLLKLGFVQADKPNGRKYQITVSGKEYINTHPPNQRLTK